jgi:chitinase
MNKIINGYWGGYFDSPITLNKTPDYFNVITLAFAGPDVNNTLSTEFLCSKYTQECIMGWMKDVKQNNKECKILLSIIDNPTYHWNVIDKDIFSQHVLEVVNEWGFDGIDIDGESGMPDDVFVQNFVNLTQDIKKKLPSHKIITYTCYEGIESNDGDILRQIKDDIHWINTMAYFDDLQSMKQLYTDYQTIMDDRICIGVKAGSKDDSSVTPLDEVKKLCKFEPHKRGMMLWTINRDTKSFTGYKDHTWANMIHISLKLKTN